MCYYDQGLNEKKQRVNWALLHYELRHGLILGKAT
jgi:hypothetical protein